MRNIDTSICTTAASVSCNSALIENCEQPAARRFVRDREKSRRDRGRRNRHPQISSADPVFGFGGFESAVERRRPASRIQVARMCRAVVCQADTRGTAWRFCFCVFAGQIDKSRGTEGRQIRSRRSSPRLTRSHATHRKRCARRSFDGWSGIILAEIDHESHPF